MLYLFGEELEVVGIKLRSRSEHGLEDPIIIELTSNLIIQRRRTSLIGVVLFEVLLENIWCCS